MNCPKCHSHDVAIEVYYNLLGQEGKEPEQLDVAVCKTCHHRWDFRDTNSTS